jgi:hypothetical protein
MQKSYRLANYSDASFDQYLCLKPPLMLWVAILFLSRAVALPFMVGISTMNGGSLQDLASATGGLVGLNTLLPSLVALTVPYAFLRRSPTGSRLSRWIWAHGRSILAVAAALDLAMSLWEPLFRHRAYADHVEFALLVGLFDVYFFVYILTSRRLRDVFSDFPAADPSGLAHPQR